MLNITFNEKDRELAERIQRDLQSSPVKFSQSYNIVVVNSASLKDDEVNSAIAQSQQKGEQLVALMLEDVALPASLKDALQVDCKDGYRARKLNAALRRHEVGAERVSRNNIFLAAFAVLSILIFSTALISIATGTVAFPVSEYATEDAANQALIDKFMRPTLEAFQPRSTMDAENFPATVEAAQTRVAPFLVQTATALPQSLNATQSAIEEAATATSMALTPAGE
jgi:hypothetical protein